jgi:hypothetical protein
MEYLWDEMVLFAESAATFYMTYQNQTSNPIGNIVQISSLLEGCKYMRFKTHIYVNRVCV